MLWPEAAKTFKIAEVAPYMLRADLGAVNSKTVTVNKDYWNSLPKRFKGVLQDVAIAYRDHVAGSQWTAPQPAATPMSQPVAPSSTDPAERAAWAAAMPNIAAEWAADLDGKGEPGTRDAERLPRQAEDAGYEGVRDWPRYQADVRAADMKSNPSAASGLLPISGGVAIAANALAPLSCWRLSVSSTSMCCARRFNAPFLGRDRGRTIFNCADRFSAAAGRGAVDRLTRSDGFLILVSKRAPESAADAAHDRCRRCLHGG